MQPIKYVDIVTDAIDYLAGWEFLAPSELSQTARIVADLLCECERPRLSHKTLCKAHVFIVIAGAMLHNGSNGRLPIKKAVSLANRYLVAALSVLLG